ncbi:MAG: hypothetical protein CMB47_01370 [Euryarchaeota archaeon]|nr:hypothetical protein [Euryarchaeota archaeon]
MREITKLFIPSFKSLRYVFNETNKTSISRERFIDFLKTFGLMLLVINSFSFLDINYSGGEYLIINNSYISSNITIITWFTVGLPIFIFSMGFTNLIAWYSNVGRDGSQWNYLVDRINSLLGPVLVLIFSVSIVLNVLLRTNLIPNYLTTTEDGVISLVEFTLWPLWLVSIYMVMVMFAPLTIYLHKKYPYLTLLVFGLATFFIDIIEVPINYSYIQVFNYLFFWLTIHQLGYFYADGKIQILNKRIYFMLALLSYGFLYYQVIFNNILLNFANYRLNSIGNEDPPSAYYLVVSLAFIFFLISLQTYIDKLLNYRKVWLIFSHVHSNIYTIYLWHLISLIVVLLFNLNPLNVIFIHVLVTFVFGNYERFQFNLSPNLVQRVNPLQPWPTPIKARFSLNNFSLAWVSTFLILLGIIHLTLGGIGQDGFFNIREFYFLRSNTFEGIGRILIGVLLLNTTVRGSEYKNKLLLLAAFFMTIAMFTRQLIDESITNFEYVFTISIVIYFLYLLIPKSNYKLSSKVK